MIDAPKIKENCGFAGDGTHGTRGTRKKRDVRRDVTAARTVAASVTHAQVELATASATLLSSYH